MTGQNDLPVRLLIEVGHQSVVLASTTLRAILADPDRVRRLVADAIRTIPGPQEVPRPAERTRKRAAS